MSRGQQKSDAAEAAMPIHRGLQLSVQTGCCSADLFLFLFFHKAWISRAERTLETSEFNLLLLLMRTLWCEERLGRRKQHLLRTYHLLWIHVPGPTASEGVSQLGPHSASVSIFTPHKLSLITYMLISHRGKGLIFIT